MPEKTLEAVADHGEITGDTVTGTADAAQAVFDKLAAVGIDLPDVFKVLEDEGVDKFEKSWQELLDATQGQLRRRGEMSDCTQHPGHGWVNPLRDKRDKRMPRIAGPCAVVIFGVTGDLARKKLMPAIYDLANRGLLPPTFALVGFARRDWADEDFSEVVHDAVKQHARTPFRQEVWDRLAEGIRFVQGTFDDDDAFTRLADTLPKLDSERGTGGNHAFYLSIPPTHSRRCCEQLSKSGLADKPDGCWSRVVIEKPFGHDLESAEALNGVVNSVFPESSVFRIDHYLGKETVQNMLALRFANEMFEPDLERPLRRPRADHHGRGHRIGRSRRLLRRHRRGPRRDPEPSAAAARAHRDGGAGQLPPARVAGREDQGAVGHHSSSNRSTRPRRAGSTPPAGRAARRSSACSTRRVLEDLHHRDVRGDHPRRGHPPLGGGSVLSAHRKTVGPQGHRDRADVQARTASAVRRHHDRGTRPERAGDPGAARRGHHPAVRLQGARAPAWRSAT